jgi:hypothetical protein
VQLVLRSIANLSELEEKDWTNGRIGNSGDEDVNSGDNNGGCDDVSANGSETGIKGCRSDEGDTEHGKDEGDDLRRNG